MILVLASFCPAAAAAVPSFELRVEVLSTEKPVVKIFGRLAESRQKWPLADSYANADNLAARFFAFKFLDENGGEVSFVTTGANELKTETAIRNFSYEVKLNFPANAAQAAHISWLAKDGGLVMPADLLPDLGDEEIPGKITFNLPPNWEIATSENEIGSNEFRMADVRHAVFLIGNFSQQNSQFGKSQINLARAAGEWSFSATEMLDLATTILAEHQKVFGSLPAGKIQIVLLPFVQKFGNEQWEAETRGSTIVLCAAQIAFKSRALSKLHEQLRHELLHLWLPNNLHLKGDYAWFYEGFTLYQALKTGVRLKYLRFDDFLDALSRAFDAAGRNPQNKSLSLLEASRLRWSGNLAELVYAKGMIIAFVCDLKILQKSIGKSSLDDVFKVLSRRSQKHNKIRDANEAVLEILKSLPELRPMVEKYVEMPGEIEWTSDLTVAGITNASKISLTRLAVKDRLNGRQKKLLAALGYQKN